MMTIPESVRVVIESASAAWVDETAARLGALLG